jgi:Tfp pilus assembly protein PilO
VGLEIGYIEPETPIPGEQFDTYRYRLRVNGSYHEIGEFLTGIASMTRIVAPIGMQLQAANTGAAAKNSSPDKVILTASFSIQTYAVKTARTDDSGNPPPAAKPARKG